MATKSDKKPEEPRAVRDTGTLRAMWTQSAANLVAKLRAGEQVRAEDVEKLQVTLEGIEAREEVGRLNAIARGDHEGA